MKITKSIWRGADPQPLSPERQAAIDVLCGRRATPVVVEKRKRTPARYVQADVSRVIKAAKKAGAGAIKIDMANGTISIDPVDKPESPQPVNGRSRL
jgi:hypothetical protein